MSCRSSPLCRAVIPSEPSSPASSRPQRPDQMPGMWQRYYPHWQAATREFLNLNLLELMPPLAALWPPATVIDKTRYSGFAEPKLLAHLREREADALIISGSETDVCLLATVLSAVDLVTASSSRATPCVARRMRDTTCCCASITPALASRSKRPMRKRSCRSGSEDLRLSDRCVHLTVPVALPPATIARCTRSSATCRVQARCGVLATRAGVRDFANSVAGRSHSRPA
jgi:Isochorismatase family